MSLKSVAQQDSSKVCIDTLEVIRIANEFRTLKSQNDYLINELAICRVDAQILQKNIENEKNKRKKAEKKTEKLEKRRVFWVIGGVIVGILTEKLVAKSL